MPEKPDKKFEATISVNGQAVKDSYPENQKIQVAVKKALSDTGNKDDLSLYDVTFNGKPVDVSKSWKDSGIPEKATIILSNKPGKKA
ncbi:MAG: hypothetical protein QOD77_358 [Thermoplasmata archaeon]|nr:hypothetical protein [Thermoplasmata archaeon]